QAHLGPFAPEGSAAAKWLGYLDKFVIFPRRLKKLIEKQDFSLVHICDHSNSMYALKIRAPVRIATCHDLLAIRSALGDFPANPTPWTGRQLQKWILKGINSLDGAACVSEATARDLRRCSKLSPPQIET